MNCLVTGIRGIFFSKLLSHEETGGDKVVNVLATIHERKSGVSVESKNLYGYDNSSKYK